MKTMKNFAAQQLSKTAMNEIKGGVSQAEYCATMAMLIEHNWKDWDDATRQGATIGYSKNC